MVVYNVASTKHINSQPLTIGINAQLVSGESGGIEQAVIGLAAGLSQLPPSQEKFLFLTLPGLDDWLRPYVSGACEIVHSSASDLSQYSAIDLKSRIVSMAPRLIRALDPVRKYVPIRLERTTPLASDATLETGGAEVIHFPYQNGFRTTAHTIFQPWDLQHRHLPELFSKKHRVMRDARYLYLCRQARFVVVASHWGKTDLITQYGIAPGKIAVVPMAPPTNVYPIPTVQETESIQRRLKLPDAFLFYPAQTFAHKNHIGLIKALAYLKQHHGVEIPIVCSGKMNEFFPTIERHARRSGVWDQLTFLGFVKPLELQAIYRMSLGLVFPSRFEGWGLPVTEAFQIGTPVACSTTTCLPEQVGDAALTFDPDSTRSIADAVLRLWNDKQLRDELSVRGSARVTQYNWNSVARNFRALYRVAADRPTSADDDVRIAQAFNAEHP